MPGNEGGVCQFGPDRASSSSSARRSRVLQVHQRPAVQLEQVEDQVGHRGLPGQQLGRGLRADVHAGLQGLELRPAVSPEHDDLPVQEELLVGGGRAEAGQLGVGDRDVALAAGHQADLALFDVGQGPDAVPLHLQRPAVLVAGRGPGDGEHGPDGPGQLQSFAVDHPLAALGLEQHVPAGDPLAVQHHLDLAGRPLQHLVAAVVPDGDRARAVLPPRDLPLEAAVLQRVIFGVHGQVVDRRVARHALGQGPGDQHPVALEAEVPVQRGGRGAPGSRTSRRGPDPAVRHPGAGPARASGRRRACPGRPAACPRHPVYPITVTGELGPRSVRQKRLCL